MASEKVPRYTVTPQVPGFAAGTGKTPAWIRYRPGVKPYVAESE
jgi:hypothetical protein